MLEEEVEVALVHRPQAWCRSYARLELKTMDGPRRFDRVFLQGPVGVAMDLVQQEVWWLVFHRESGQVLACFEDLDHAQTLGDTLAQMASLDATVAGAGGGRRAIRQWCEAVRKALNTMASQGIPVMHPTTNRPTATVLFMHAPAKA